MSLTLYYHPFASFCQKVLVALYESDVAFEPHLVDLGDERSRKEFEAIWPPGRFPVLRDHERDRTIPESTLVIEYLAVIRTGARRLIPADPQRALLTRQWDRFFDHDVELPMQKIVTDRLRPADRHDPHGVEEARAMLNTAYEVLESHLPGKTWASGDAFDMADCAAAPALFYANMVEPFEQGHPQLKSYFLRLMARPSVARVVEEARPYRKLFPLLAGEVFPTH